MHQFNEHSLSVREVCFQREVMIFSVDVRFQQEKTSEVLFDLDPLQAPGVYKVRVDVYYPITDKIVAESDAANQGACSMRACMCTCKPMFSFTVCVINVFIHGLCHHVFLCRRC